MRTQALQCSDYRHCQVIGMRKPTTVPETMRALLQTIALTGMGI